MSDYITVIIPIVKFQSIIIATNAQIIYCPCCGWSHTTGYFCNKKF